MPDRLWYNRAMQLKKLAAVGILTAALAVTCFAASNVLGTWKGHVIFDKAKLPKSANPAQQKQMEAGLAQAAKMVITLKLTADHKFTARVDGVQTKDRSDGGTWTLKGSALTLTSNKDKQKQVFTVAKNGKSLTATTTPFVKIVFTR